MANKKPQETGITLAQVNNAVRNALEKKKADAPKKKPITENPTYLKLLEKYDSLKASKKRALEKAEEAYNTSSVVGTLVKGAIAVPFGWIRNKTRLLDKLPGATLANGALPDLIVGGISLGVSLYGQRNGWSQTAVNALADLSDVAIISGGLRVGTSITMFDTAAQAINDALAIAGMPTAAAPLHQQAAVYGQPQVRERFSWG